MDEISLKNFRKFCETHVNLSDAEKSSISHEAERYRNYRDLALNNKWDDKTKEEFLSNTGLKWVASIGQGNLTNDDRKKLIDKFDELSLILQELAEAGDQYKPELYQKWVQLLEEWRNSGVLRKQHYRAFFRRCVIAMQPEVFARIVVDIKFYELCRYLNRQSGFENLIPLTYDYDWNAGRGGWYEDSNALFTVIKQAFPDEDPLVLTHYPWKLYEHMEHMNKIHNETGSQTIHNETGNQTSNKLLNESIEILKLNKNLILHGCPGSGKTYLAKQIAEKLVSNKTRETNQDNKYIRFVQFHSSYDYTDFVEGLRPCNENGSSIGFCRKDGIFKQLCRDAAKDYNNKYVLIIDEINRADLSRVFGELLFCIDADYRSIISSDNKAKYHRVNTQYQNLVPDTGDTDIFVKGFFVPDNVYIIGTMNDVDRNVESIDFALRRRFYFKEIRAADNLGMFPANWSPAFTDEVTRRLKTLNEAIADMADLGSIYEIGGAYFKGLCDPSQDETDGLTVDKLWNYRLESLLREYLRGSRDADAKLEILHNAYLLKTATTANQ